MDRYYAAEAIETNQFRVKPYMPIVFFIIFVLLTYYSLAVTVIGE